MTLYGSPMFVSTITFQPTKIPPWLYGGQSPTNIKEMVVDELEEVLPYIGRMPLPVYIGKNIVEKVCSGF